MVVDLQWSSSSSRFLDTIAQVCNVQLCVNKAAVCNAQYFLWTYARMCDLGGGKLRIPGLHGAELYRGQAGQGAVNFEPLFCPRVFSSLSREGNLQDRLNCNAGIQGP